MNESDVPFLSIGDLPARSLNQQAASVSFFSICHLLEDIAGAIRRNEMTPGKVRQLKNELYMWVRELPSELRLFHPQKDLGLNEYNFDSRQLHIVYFVVLMLLFRKAPSSSGLAGSILAASFVAAIFEELLIRDEINCLGPGIYKFFLLTTGITLLPACRIYVLQTQASEDYDIIKKALGHFAERYPSSLGSLHTLEAVEKVMDRNSESPENLQPLSSEDYMLFREFGPGLCRLWDFMGSSSNDRDSGARGARQPTNPQSLLHESLPGDEVASGLDNGNSGFPLPSDAFDMTSVTRTEGLDSLWTLSWSDQPDPTSWVLRDGPFDIGNGFDYQ